MKELVCYFCKENWFVNDEKEDKVNVCPFCSEKVIRLKDIVVDSFEKAIMKIILECGIEILNDSNRFFGYFNDVAFEFRKEKKILTRACDDRTLKKFYELSKQTSEEAQKNIEKIKEYIIEEEAIAESWAERICNAFYDSMFPKSKLRESIMKTTSQVKKEKDNGLLLEVLTKKYEDKIIDLGEEFVGSFGGLKRYMSITDMDIQKFKLFMLPSDVDMLYLHGIETISKNTFLNCQKLKMVCINSDVKEIEENAFDQFDNLKYVVFLGKKNPVVLDKKLIKGNGKQIYCSIKNTEIREWGMANIFCYDYGYGYDPEKRNIIKLEKILKA